MGTWAQLIGGTPSTLLGSGRSFTAQAAYATGQAAPLTSSWLSQTLIAVQTFQIAANVTVMSSLDVGGVVVSTPSSNTLVQQCGASGSGVLCTALVPSIIVGGFFVAMFICAVIINRRRILNGGYSRFVANLLGKKTSDVGQHALEGEEGVMDGEDSLHNEPYSCNAHGEEHNTVVNMNLDSTCTTNHQHTTNQRRDERSTLQEGRYYTTE